MPGAPRSSDGRFHNLDGSGAQPPGAVFRWAVLERLAGRRRRSPATAQVPSVAPDRALIATPATAPRITWLGHASFLVQLDGASVLIDPIFSERIAGLIRRNVPPPLAARSLRFRRDGRVVTSWRRSGSNGMGGSAAAWRVDPLGRLSPQSTTSRAPGRTAPCHCADWLTR